MSKIDFYLEDMQDNVQAPRPVPILQHIQDMNININTREIFITGEITDDFGGWFTAALRYLETQSNSEDIVIWLNTPGGNVQAMFTFHDLVRSSPCKIIIIGVGEVCSAGVLMLACGNVRLVTESCTLMSHRSHDSVSGNLEHMESYLKVLKWSEEHWANLMARYTPDEIGGRARDAKYWFQLGKKTAEWWITGGAMIVEEGLADAIYTYEKLPKALQ